MGNLPLCVGIYSSVKASRSRQTDSDDCGDALSFDKWKDLERTFGDRFHHRGLGGVLKVAQKTLRSQPLVLLLLAKVSCCFSESVPWISLLCNQTSDFSLRSVVWIEDELSGVFAGLTKIADWLFSSQGTESLVRGRDKFEAI